MIDEQREEQAALCALDALEGDEKSAFEAELSGNAELRQLVDELREAAALVAHRAPLRLPPPELEQKILHEIRAEKPLPVRTTPRVTWLPWAIAAAAALFCGLLLNQRAAVARKFAAAQEQIGTLRAERDRAARAAAEKDREVAAAQTEVEKLRAEREGLLQQVGRWRQLEETMRVQNRTLAEQRTELEKKIAELEKLGGLSQLRVATLTSKQPNAERAAGTIVWDPDKQQGILKTANVPVIGPDKDYQLWLVDPEYKQPVDAGCFTVDEKGETEFTFRPKLRVTSAKAFAVSLERKGGVRKAEGPMVLVSN